MSCEDKDATNRFQDLLLAAWNVATAEDRDWFLRRINQSLPETMPASSRDAGRHDRTNAFLGGVCPSWEEISPGVSSSRNREDAQRGMREFLSRPTIKSVRREADRPSPMTEVSQDFLDCIGAKKTNTSGVVDDED